MTESRNGTKSEGKVELLKSLVKVAWCLTVDKFNEGKSRSKPVDNNSAVLK